MPTIQKAYVDIPGGQMHYRILAGDPAAAPVLLFHRAPVTSASFEGVMRVLAGWRTLIAFDTPGFGQSLTPPDDATFEDILSIFVAAIDALGLTRVHLVGHHSGANWAAALAARLPERTLSLMIDGAMATTPKERAAQAPLPATIVDDDGAYAQRAWAFIRPYYTVFDPACIHAELVGALASAFTRGATMAAVRGHDIAADMSRLTCPVLATAAEDDVFVPHLDRIRAACPHAVIQTYGKAGIAAPELQTAAFAGAVQLSVTRS